MKRRTCSLVLLLPALLVLAGCGPSKHQLEADQLASNLLHQLVASSAQTPNEWGMTDVRLFGSPDRAGWFRPSPCGLPETTKVPDSPETYEVRLEFWCRGKDPGGETIQRRYTLQCTVVAASADAPLAVRTHTLVNDGELTWPRQFFTWLGKACLVTLFVSAILAFALPRHRVGRCLIVVIVLPLLLLLAGFLAHLHFESGAGVVVCVPVYILIVVPVVAAVAAIARALIVGIIDGISGAFGKSS